MEFTNINGDIIEAEKGFIKANNRSFRYGEGLFETMRIVEGRILLSNLHFERLFKSLSLLKFQIPAFFTPNYIEKDILNLCEKNNCEKSARVRLSVSAGNGGLYDGDEKFQYVIEGWTLSHTIDELNEKGFVIDIFPGVRKACDSISHLKSASHLPYVIAARFVKENRLNDSLLLNMHNRICDSTIANIFWVKDGKIFTPPLSEGCIAGVMRKYLIETLFRENYELGEKECNTVDIENADEVFLTNAIQGIKWVAQFRDKLYSNSITREIYSRYITLQK